MKPSIARRSGLAVALLCVAVLSSNPAATLIYVSGTASAGEDLLLRRDGERLVLVNQQSQAIVASAPASRTERVVIAGGADRDDTLTLDLSSPIVLPRGIDYDGGARGWDTLVVTGGFVHKETVTQLTPHDGVFDLDGLSLRYTNLEPITDTAPAVSLFLIGTAGADTVTIADGPGAGEATISSPTFESYTFANKTAVIFDGLGGDDSVVLDNPTVPTGLQSLIIQNVATVGQTSTFSYPMFAVSATGTVDLDEVGPNDVDIIELVTNNGDISYLDVDDVVIGGVSTMFTGLHVETSGSISFIAGGTISLNDNDGFEIVHSGTAAGDVDIFADGIDADVAVTSGNNAITSPAGYINVTAGRDILIGTLGTLYNNDITASDFASLDAARDVVIAGTSSVFADAFGNHTGAAAGAGAGRDVLLRDAASFGASGEDGGNALVIAPEGSVLLTATGAAAISSASGFVGVGTARLVIDVTSGISAPEGNVLIISPDVPVDVGSTTDAGPALEISDAELDRIDTPTLAILAAVSITVTQPITYANALGLSAETFTATGGGSLSAPTLILESIALDAQTWTADATGVTVSPGSRIPYSGVTSLNLLGGDGSDTFNVTPSPSTTIGIDGWDPLPPASPGDTLNVNTSGTTSPFLTSSSDANGISGTYSFGNRALVGFINIETLDAATDLAITKTDGVASQAPGTVVTYTIVASNPGGLGVGAATVFDTFPAALSGVAWTCTASPDSACNPNGFDSLNEFVDLAVGGTATFTVTATINANATGALTNTVTITPPGGTNDPNSGNNSATDIDLLLANTTIATNASAGVPLGGTVHDTATIANGSSPTGTVTFRLYGPDDASCSGAVAFTQGVTISGNGSYDSASFTPAQTGVYRWIASYSGDANNAAATGACNDANESVTVADNPCPTLTATPAVLPPAIAGEPYSQIFAVPNGTAPVTFTLTGTLPAGLSFSGAELSGVPTERGAFAVTLNATDANGCTGSFPYLVSVSRDRFVAVGIGAGGGAAVRTFGVHSWTPRLDVTAYAPPFAGGVSVAQGDTNGDGVTDVVTGAGPGGSPLVKVLNGHTGAERLSFLAYDADMASGIEVAAGDVNGDGIVDIITVAGPGGPPVVRIFDGLTGTGLGQFFGMAPTWTSGLHVAAGDLNGDGLADIIVGSGPSGPPLVQVFDAAGGTLLGQFLAYDASVQTGVYVASGDVNGDGFADIVTGPGEGGGPHVRVFNGLTGEQIDGPLGGFFAYTPEFGGGVRVGAGDFDGDGVAEVITGAGPGGGPHVRVFDGATGNETLGLLAFDSSSAAGVFVAGPPAVGRMAIDLVQAGGGTLRVAGWALLETSTAGPGTDAIHAWAYPVSGGPAVFVGAAVERAARFDVAAALGGEFLMSGFDFTGTLASGTYDLVIYVRNEATLMFDQRRVVRITIP